MCSLSPFAIASAPIYTCTFPQLREIIRILGSSQMPNFNLKTQIFDSQNSHHGLENYLLVLACLVHFSSCTNEDVQLLRATEPGVFGQRVGSEPLLLACNGLRKTNSITFSVSHGALNLSRNFRDMFVDLNPALLCGFTSSQDFQCL